MSTTALQNNGHVSKHNLSCQNLSRETPSGCQVNPFIFVLLSGAICLVCLLMHIVHPRKILTAYYMAMVYQVPVLARLRQYWPKGFRYKA